MVATQQRMVFINLPVRDLQRSIEFFTALGFTFNPQFTDASATCMILSEQAFVMLLVEPRFKEFTSKKLCDTSRSIEAIFALSACNREEVDALVGAALEAGGTTFNPPVDHGFMYVSSFLDPDGHSWEVVYMEPGATE